MMMTLANPRAMRWISVFAAFFSLQIAFAQSAVLSAPNAQNPAGYITDASPIFQWEAVPGATTYGIQWTDTSDSFDLPSYGYTGSPYFKMEGLSSPSFDVSTLGIVFDQSKQYHWIAYAIDANGQPGPPSPIESFLVYDPAIVPQVTGPLGYIPGVSATFTWTAIPNAVSYDLLILTADENTTINLVNVSTNSYQEPANMPLPLYTVYHYKVRAHMPDGTTGIYSNPGSFMEYSSADTPHLLSPTVQAPVGANFSWAPVGTAVGYEIMVTSADETVTYIDDNTVTVNGYAAPAGKLAPGAVYHWKVRSNLASGQSLWSDTFSFLLIDPAIIPDPILPFGYVKPLSIVQKGAPTAYAFPSLYLEWSQVDNAKSYTVTILDSATQAQLYTATVSATDTMPVPDTRFHLTRTLSTQLGLQVGTSYDWYVSATLNDGRVSANSQARSFKATTDTWIGHITNVAVRNRALNQPIKVTFDTLNLNSVTIRYHVILRVEGTKTAPAQTLYSSDVSTFSTRVTKKHYDKKLKKTVIDATQGTGELVLPADVITVMQANQAYSFVVEAYDLNQYVFGEQVLIGESYKHTFRPVGKP